MVTYTAAGQVSDKAGHLASMSATFDVDAGVGPSMLVGASHKINAQNNPVPLEAAMGLTGSQKLDLFRCYDTGGPPASWGGSAFGQHFGRRGMWWSCKGDIVDWANPNGSNIRNAKALAQSYDPDWPTLYWTIWHEVQPKLVERTFTFAQFAAAWTNFYNAIRPLAPPNVQLAVIHGGYGWRPGSTETTVSGTYSATPSEWRSLPVDFYAVDAYGGPQAEDIFKMARFQRFAKEMAGGDYSKVAIAESNVRQEALLKQAGGDPVKADQAGVDWMHDNGDLFGNAGLRAWCLWNSTATELPGPITPNQARAYGDVWRKWSPNR